MVVEGALATRPHIKEHAFEDIATPTGAMRVHLFQPQTPGHYPGIVLYSEIYQITEPVRRMAVFLAGQGFVVSAPEVYHEYEKPGTVLLYDAPGTERGNYWWLDYRAPSNLIKIADLLDWDVEFSHPFYKALWYWHEVELRISVLSAQMPSLKIVRFETGWLNDATRVFELLDGLGIEYDKGRVEARIGIREHEKVEQKLRPALSSGETQIMLDLFLEMLASRGFDAARDRLTASG